MWETSGKASGKYSFQMLWPMLFGRTEKEERDDLAQGLSEGTNNIPLANGGVILKGVPETGSD